MNVENYFKSITLELNGLRDRVRNFIDDSHWLTDGEWKESVLRSFLNKNIAQSLTVGRGFIVTPSGPTTQIDVLIYDVDSPVLFRDGDLVFISPEAVRGIIEVKTNIEMSGLKLSLKKLRDIGEKINRGPRRSLFGLFAYESEIASNDRALTQLRSVCTYPYGITDILCLGASNFIKFWHHNPIRRNEKYEKWHSYKLENMAYGYFIHNILVDLSPKIIEDYLWFPENGKEISKDGEISPIHRRRCL